VKILGIETSCDETAAAVVESAGTRRLKLLSNEVASSVDLHAAYGGVVPEIASRSHLEVIVPTINQALRTAGVGWEAIDAIAVTQGPGLGGSLLIGVLSARTLAIAHDKPLYAVNHVEAHSYAPFITETALPGYQLGDTQPEFPFLSLTVSGGHTQLVLFKGHGDYEVLGRTQDDAIGEAFDKVAKITGLPYPGGPSISQAALKGDPGSVRLPKAKLEGEYDFSFSGLKTAVLRAAQEMIGKDYAFPSKMLPESLSEAQKDDIAASFQRIAVETVVDKTVLAFEAYHPASVVLAGGVAANSELRRQLSERLPALLHLPDLKLCTDNAAMVAASAFYHQTEADPYTLAIAPSLRM
jgi:N6-L-threonylcarbamoyladenine synthase